MEIIDKFYDWYYRNFRVIEITETIDYTENSYPSIFFINYTDKGIERLYDYRRIESIRHHLERIPYNKVKLEFRRDKKGQLETLAEEICSKRQ